MKWSKWFVTADVKRAVAQGARRLDANRPGWRHLVILGTLDMWDAEFCVLGQVYGSYEEGLRQLGLHWAADPEYGFYPLVGEQWATRRQWKRVIRRGLR